MRPLSNSGRKQSGVAYPPDFVQFLSQFDAEWVPELRFAHCEFAAINSASNMMVMKRCTLTLHLMPIERWRCNDCTPSQSNRLLLIAAPQRSSSLSAHRCERDALVGLTRTMRHGQHSETRANLLDFVFPTVLVVRAEQAASCTDMQLVG